MGSFLNRAHRRRQVRVALAPFVIEIEHIGSTAVPGLAVKPVIDIQVGVRTPGDSAEIAQRSNRSATSTSAGVACEGCPPLTSLLDRYAAAGGRYFVCRICFNTKGSTTAA